MTFNPQYESAISSERLAPYRHAGTDDDHAWALYQWNKELSSAAAFLAADLEVTLRNTIHTQLGTHFKRPDWWASSELRLDDETREMLSEVTSDHQKKVAKGTVSPGRVVSNLMFGAWVNLVGAGGRTSLGESLDYEKNLWRPALHLGFTTGESNSRGAPRRPVREQVYSRAANFKRLRNRIAHHEPIHRGIIPPGGGSKVPLVEVWTAGLELLRWMNPDLAQLHADQNLVPGLFARRPS